MKLWMVLNRHPLTYAAIRASLSTSGSIFVTRCVCMAPTAEEAILKVKAYEAYGDGGHQHVGTWTAEEIPPQVFRASHFFADPTDEEIRKYKAHNKCT